MVETDRSERYTDRTDRRTILRALGGGAVAGLAGCLGGDDDGDDGGGGDDGGDGDGGGSDGNGGDGDDEPYLRAELENAMANLEAPDPGAGVVVFENDGEYHSATVDCGEDIGAPDDPEKGEAEGTFEFEDGEEFRVEVSRLDDVSGIRNTITLTVPNPDDDGPEEYAIPRSLWPIKAEEGGDGSSAYVLRDDGTWYGGIGFDSPDEIDREFGETWVAITCD